MPNRCHEETAAPARAACCSYSVRSTQSLRRRLPYPCAGDDMLLSQAFCSFTFLEAMLPSVIVGDMASIAKLRAPVLVTTCHPPEFLLPDPPQVPYPTHLHYTRQHHPRSGPTLANLLP